MFTTSFSFLNPVSEMILKIDLLINGIIIELLVFDSVFYPFQVVCIIENI